MCNQQDNGRTLSRHAIDHFKGAPHAPHHPKSALIACVDGRVGGGGHLGIDGSDAVLRFTGFGGVVPAYANASDDFKAKVAFMMLKGVDSVMIEAHSFCGAAQAALAYPDPNKSPTDLQLVVRSIAATGADLPRLNKALREVCEGNEEKAANLLSRHLAVLSLQNFSAYPGVGDKIVRGELDVTALYYALRQNTGEESYLEHFDVTTGEWELTTTATRNPQKSVTHLCTRPFNCAACVSCHDTLGGKLGWVPHPVANGRMILLPHDISTHLHRIMSGAFEKRQNPDGAPTGQIPAGHFQPALVSQTKRPRP